METRSSPSLQVLEGLARHAHMEPENLSSLSKPALFGHLRSNYDFARLERAHQIALKRSGATANASLPDTTTFNSKYGGNINKSDTLTPRSKRPCRVASSGGSSSSSRSNGAGSAAGTAGFELQQSLPPASIFVQTRSRSRLLAAASACTSTSSTNAQSSSPPPALAALNTTSTISLPAGRPVREVIVATGGGSGTARATRSSSRSSSPRPRTGGRRGSPLKLSCGADASPVRKAARRGSSSGSGSNGDTAAGSGERGRAGSGSAVVGGSSSACAAGGDGASVEMYEATGSANTAKRKRANSGSGSGSGGASSNSRRKGKGKGKAKVSSGGIRGGSSSCKTKGKGKGHGRGACDGGGDAPVAKGSRENVAHGSGDGGKDEEDDDGDGQRTNELDPIMLVKLGKDCHRFVRPNGRVVVYNLDSLVDYFISTGDFLEPETRLPFSDEELRVIDAKVKAVGLSKPSVLEAKKNPGQYTEQKFQQDALVGLERMTSELVTGMLKVVEESDREEGEIRLVTELFPPFADLFKQIRAADRRFAAQCMQHYTSWLQGPPNRPTEDEMGFLDIILGFLKHLQECEGNSVMGF